MFGRPSRELASKVLAEAQREPEPGGRWYTFLYECTNTNAHAPGTVWATLPNGNSIRWYGGYRWEVVRDLAKEEVADGYLSESAAELFRSRDYEFWEYIFGAYVRRPRLGGEHDLEPVRVGDIVPGDQIDCFAAADFREALPADEPPVLDDLTAAANRPPVDGLFGYHFFFVVGIGVELPAEGFAELPLGIQWWPSVSFPYSATVLASISPPSSVAPTFTGVLLVPLEIGAGAENDELSVLACEARRRLVGRLQAGLEIVLSRRMTVVAETAIRRTDKGVSYRQQAALSYVHLDSTRGFQRVRLDQFRRIAERVFVEVKPRRKKEAGQSLHQLLPRSLEVFAVSRSVVAMSISLPLAWIAVEALLAPGVDVAQSMGAYIERLTENEVSRSDFKAHYDVRCSIVHEYFAPSPERLEREVLFVATLYRRLIEFVLVGLESGKFESRNQLKTVLGTGFATRRTSFWDTRCLGARRARRASCRYPRTRLGRS